MENQFLTPGSREGSSSKEGPPPDKTAGELKATPPPDDAPKEGKVCCSEKENCQHVVKLGHSNHVKERFLATLAHELRTPLGSILNAVELLRSQQSGDAVEVIERQVRHMGRLVDDILDLSRIRNDKITIRKVRLDLVQAVQKTAQAALFSFMKYEQHFTTTLWPEPLWVEADPVRIEQVVTNLLTNAAKYTSRTKGGAEIWLKLTREGNHAVLQVRDEGIGIPADMLEKIFEPFVQAESSLSRSRGGLGLGLTLVRQLVGLHGGTVTVESAGPGRGAEFSVRLPLAVSTGAGQDCGSYLIGEPARARPSSSSRVRHRVLLVEDNADMAETLALLMRTWGHSVEVVPNGGAALAAALRFSPDIALVDIGLPGLNGYAVARQLSKEPSLKGLHLIAMSGYGQESDRIRAKEAGFEGYVLKPVEPDNLRSWLAQEDGGEATLGRPL
jgi:CheY-like chemotaxis protein